MRILLLANHFNTGGITSYLLTLIKGLVGAGHEVTVMTSGGDAVPRAEALGSRHISVASLKVKNAFHPGLGAAVVAVARYVRDNRIDLMHAQTRVTQSVACMTGLLTRRPYVSTCHGFFNARFFRTLVPMYGARVIAISGPVQNHLTDVLGADPARVQLVANGVDLATFHPVSSAERLRLRARFGFTGEPVVGIIARLSDVKGHCYLIEAMHELVHRLPDVRCLIVGAGPEEERLRDQVRQLKLEKTVIFSKMNGRPEEILPALDVFVMPSLQEGLGLSVMEAEACGIPVIASRVGGLVDAVRDGETGLLVPPRDHLALSHALWRVLTDPVMAARFTQAGPEWIKQRFTVETMIAGTLDVYSSVLARRPA
jgi:glycosyltransferase involved in cell wall biosynthesis